jgi:hypothetical protein
MRSAAVWTGLCVAVAMVAAPLMLVALPHALAVVVAVAGAR